MSVAAGGGWWYLDDEQLETVLLGLLGSTAWWLGLAVAVGAGALHALGPGHGKTLVGAYLAGGNGRARDAVAVGGLVAAMHTGAVLAVGLLVHATTQVPGAGWLEGALRLVSAVAVTAVGVGLLRRSVRRTPAEPVGAEPTKPSPRHADGMLAHAHHDHDIPPGVAPLSRAGIAAVATTGGLLPSPAAIVLLAVATAAGRIGYGLVLVGAFGLGLAGMVTVVGLAALWGRELLALHPARDVRRLVAHLPLITAVGIILGGLWLAVLATRAF